MQWFMAPDRQICPPDSGVLEPLKRPSRCASGCTTALTLASRRAVTRRPLEPRYRPSGKLQLRCHRRLL